MTTPPTLTTTGGAPIADNQNSETARPRGPVLLQDVHLLEKLAHQNRERIPERVVQPGALYRLFDDGERARLHANVAAAMQGVPEAIVARQLAHFRLADPRYADGVRRALDAGRVAVAAE